MEPERLQEKLESLYNYLRNYHILTYDLRPENVLVQSLPNGTKVLIVVDGVGKRKMLWAAQSIKSYCRFYLKKRWTRFLLETYSLIKAKPDN